VAILTLSRGARGGGEAGLLARVRETIGRPRAAQEQAPR
jgi:hypothetical protein